MRIETASTSCAVPEWAEKQDQSWYPCCPGMLGDWGLGQNENVSPLTPPCNSKKGFVMVSRVLKSSPVRFFWPFGNGPDWTA